MFKTILIANRGEIACRIIRTARDMGIRSVAVFSEADRQALHVRLADQACCIGPAAAARSYLDAAAILRAAEETGAEAIHPGYGFLAENPEFAARCAAAGLVFIGPPAAVISAMGIKSQAKRIMAAAGIPVLPGYCGKAGETEELRREAARLGFPLLIKADRGGGGTGIRLVGDGRDFDEAAEGAAREAAAAFGDDRLLLERFLPAARHIEVQIFRDSHGNSVHLFERDCSLQRRHQKIIEESPAPGLPDELRRTLHETALTAADTIGYLGAGTVEFLVEDSGDYYFLEINTRLQVEHPVTEMVTGQDLVRWQLLVAAGEPLPCRQVDLHCRGHAIEVRVYAEDPERHFLPAAGTIDYLRTPEPGDGVRVDSGVRQGDEVTPFYDPLLAKLIVWGPDRESACRALRRRLPEFRLTGVATNLNFLIRLAGDAGFRRGGCGAQYVDTNLATLVETRPASAATLACAALFCVLDTVRRERTAAARGDDPFSPWSSGLGFRVNGPARIALRLGEGGRSHRVSVCPGRERFTVELPSGPVEAAAELDDSGRLSCRLQGRELTAEVVRQKGGLAVFRPGQGAAFFSLPGDDPEAAAGGTADDSLRAPLPGSVARVLVTTPSRVAPGEALLVLEAMKMEYVIRAPGSGLVTEILYRPGDTVSEGSRLAVFEPSGEGGDAAA